MPSKDVMEPSRNCRIPRSKADCWRMHCRITCAPFQTCSRDRASAVGCLGSRSDPAADAAV